MDIVDLVLLMVLGFINLRTIFLVLTFKRSAFLPTSLFSLTVMSQMFPQILVLYINNYYSKDIIPSMLFMMILCQLAFFIGYRKSIQNTDVKEIYNFDYSRLIYLIVAFTICGMIPMFFYSSLESVYGGVNVVLGIFRFMGTSAFILSLIYLEKFRQRQRFIIVICFAFSIIPLFFFAFFVKGSREGMFVMVLVLFIFIFRNFPAYRKRLSLFFFLTFLLGSLLGESITEFRNTSVKKTSEGALTDINFVENYKRSIVDKDLSAGMDLGNGAILMKYVRENNSYDLGAEIWNGFIAFYFPSRFFGDQAKKDVSLTSLQDANTEQLESRLTKGVTTRTGYYMAFRSFSFLGCLIFYIIGYLFGNFKVKSRYSLFYLFVYITALTALPNTITHMTQYMFGRLELVFIVLFPIFYFFLKNVIIKPRKFNAEIANR